MVNTRSWRRWTGIALGAALLGGALGGITSARAESSDPGWRPPWWNDATSAVANAVRLFDIDEHRVAAGTLDDGEELLPRATLSVEQAIRVAQGTAPGAVGEVDLEEFRGRLVFNVDVGDRDVKVDATTGEALGAAGEE